MMAVINPNFGKDLKKFGAFDFNACYNCGNCTAVCSLSDENDSFPREMVRLSVLGLEDEITSSLKPWLCYYCGECSTHCPQTANPGELMMSLRRWLTAKYDWTKLSGLFFRYVALTVFTFALLTAAVVFFAVKMNFNLQSIMHYGHLFEMTAIAVVFVIVLLPNVIRMGWFILGKQAAKVPFMSYLKEFRELIVHMFTQKRALGCDDNQVRWFEHMILVIGYLALLFTTVYFDWFSANNKFIIVLGYTESVVLFVVTILFVTGRILKKREMNKFSHSSDWFFVVWLFLMGITAFGVRLFIDLELISRNLWLYLVHLTVLVQWALVIVPFGKWTHFLYRSFAMYFAKIKI